MKTLEEKVDEIISLCEFQKDRSLWGVTKKDIKVRASRIDPKKMVTIPKGTVVKQVLWGEPRFLIFAGPAEGNIINTDAKNIDFSKGDSLERKYGQKLYRRGKK